VIAKGKSMLITQLSQSVASNDMPQALKSKTEEEPPSPEPPSDPVILLILLEKTNAHAG
jgi:hypothetical protein